MGTVNVELDEGEISGLWRHPPSGTIHGRSLALLGGRREVSAGVRDLVQGRSIRSEKRSGTGIRILSPITALFQIGERSLGSNERQNGMAENFFSEKRLHRGLTFGEYVMLMEETAKEDTQAGADGG